MVLDKVQSDALTGHISFYFERGNVTHEEMLAVINMHRDHSIVNIAVSIQEFESTIKESMEKMFGAMQVRGD